MRHWRCHPRNKQGRARSEPCRARGCADKQDDFPLPEEPPGQTDSGVRGVSGIKLHAFEIPHRLLPCSPLPPPSVFPGLHHPVHYHARDEHGVIGSSAVTFGLAGRVGPATRLEGLKELNGTNWDFPLGAVRPQPTASWKGMPPERIGRGGLFATLLWRISEPYSPPHSRAGGFAFPPCSTCCFLSSGG